MIHATDHHGSVVAAMLSSQESVQRIIGSFRGIEGALGAAAAPERLAWQRELTRVELYAVANVLTPFGTVCCHHDVVGGTDSIKYVVGDTDSVEFFHIDPFAMLNDACVGSSAFANFLPGLVQAAPGHVLEFIFYLGKATPGNQQRPSVIRVAQSVCLSCLQFSKFFRIRRNGWIPFGHWSDSFDSSRLRVLTQLDSAYVLEAGGNFVITKPFDEVFTETYMLQNGYLLVGGFIAAQHLACQQNGVRYKELTDDRWWFRPWLIEPSCCDGAIHEELLEGLSLVGSGEYDNGTWTPLISCIWEELAYNLDKGLITEPLSLTGTHEEDLAGLLRCMPNHRADKWVKRIVEFFMDEDFMDTPCACEDSLEFFDLLHFLRDWPPCHFDKPNGKTWPPCVTSPDRWHCSRQGDRQHFPIWRKVLPYAGHCRKCGEFYYEDNAHYSGSPNCEP